MGHYDRERAARRRVLPWRERYAWKRLAVVGAALGTVIAVWTFRMIAGE